MRTIDADAMKEEVKNLDAESNNRTYLAAMEDMLEFFSMLIDKQPTVEPQVRHGRWIMNNPYGIKCCSECGYGRSIGAENYCPNCGAYMMENRGVENNGEYN